MFILTVVDRLLHCKSSLQLGIIIPEMQRQGATLSSMSLCRLAWCRMTTFTQRFYSASLFDLNISSASEASIRLDGTYLINFRIAKARRVSTRSGFLLLSLLSSSDTWSSFSLISKHTCIIYAQRLIYSPSNKSKSRLKLDFMRSHVGCQSFGNFPTKPIICNTRTSCSPRYWNGYDPNMNAWISS